MVVSRRRWLSPAAMAEKLWEERAEKVPQVLTALLGALAEVYPNLEDDSGMSSFIPCFKECSDNLCRET